jgi:hypothetical protein
MKQFSEYLFEEQLVFEMGREMQFGAYTIPTKALYKLYKEVKKWPEFLKRIKAKATRLEKQEEQRLKAVFNEFEKGVKFHLIGMEWR